MYSGNKERLEAIEQRLQRRLASMPLQTRRPRMTARGIARMADRAGVYSPADLRAADARAAAYDAIWGLSGDSTIAGFVDMERARSNRAVRCNQFQPGICDNAELYGGSGQAFPCPHSAPHYPFRGCDQDESGCPIFVPLVPPCQCLPVEQGNPVAHAPDCAVALNARHDCSCTPNPAVRGDRKAGVPCTGVVGSQNQEG
jgi:hypothetical protein